MKAIAKNTESKVDLFGELSKMSSESFQAPEPVTDVVELCAVLQCLGFSVKSMETCDVNLSQDSGVRNVVINCQSSGLNVVMEGTGLVCSCPPASDQNSSFWQVSAVSGGKKLDKETGSNLCSLPKDVRDRLTKDLRELVRSIKSYTEDPTESAPTEATTEVGPTNRSASLLEMNTTPEKMHLQIKADTPTRYRSLDTLTNGKEAGAEGLPAPGALLKHADASDEGITDPYVKRLMCRRQSTYTVASTPGSSTSGSRHRSKTSSPIQQSSHSLLDRMIAAEKAAEDLRNKLATIVKDFADDKMDCSMSSLVLDVSKISLLKGTENVKAQSQFASSPNLSNLGTLHEDRAKNRFKGFESASTSNLTKKATPEAKPSRLRRLSPGFFRMKKDSPTAKDQKSDSKVGKFNSLIKPKIVTPVRIPRTATPEPSPNMSASKKKYSHVKSTIPRATPRRE